MRKFNACEYTVSARYNDYTFKQLDSIVCWPVHGQFMGRVGHRVGFGKVTILYPKSGTNLRGGQVSNAYQQQTLTTPKKFPSLSTTPVVAQYKYTSSCDNIHSITSSVFRTNLSDRLGVRARVCDV